VVDLIALHLLFQGGDGGIHGGQLALDAIPPEAQQSQLAFLIPPQGTGSGLRAGAAPEGRNHDKICTVDPF